MSAYRHVSIPERGERIRVDADGRWQVPDQPIIPFIEGDGTGPDIWRASQIVFDAAVAKAYGGRRRIAWMEIFAGEKATRVYGDGVWLPDETNEVIAEFKVAIKGPLTTPVGGGIRSINVTLRQVHDLYACVRPVRYFQGVPSPVKEPQKLDVVIFRENTEDVYAGIEFKEGSAEAQALIEFTRTRLEEGDPRRFGRRHQADLGDRLEASGAACDRVRAGARQVERHPRPQGQHHEVHRGRVPRLGLRAGARRVRRPDRHRGRAGKRRRRRRARWW